MPVVRLFRSWFAWSVLALVALGPMAALCAATVLDRGPEGGVRASTYWLAMAALDPFVWTCLRNSVATAGAAAVGSMLLGLYVGRLVGDWRFPARPILIAALTASAVAPPAVLALGISVLVGSGGGSTLGWADRLGPLGRYVPGDWRWYAWFWSAVVQGGALTVLSCTSALERFDPAWRDAARLVGGARGRVWRRLGWPLLRPPLARAAGLVFALTLAEPGAPLVLGLRRTLGYQIVVAGLSGDPFPRVAVLGLLAMLAAVVVRSVLKGWAGAEPAFDSTAARPRRVGSWRRGAVGAVVAGAWLAFLIGPILGILIESMDGFSSARGAAFADRLHDPATMATFWNSARLGILVGVFQVMAGWLGRSLPQSGASARLLDLARAGLAPPLALGAAALCLPWLVGLAAELVDGGTAGGLASLARQAAAVVGSEFFRALLPALGVGLAMTPAFFAAWDEGLGNDLDRDRDDRIAAAALAGARRTRARRLASGRRRWETPRRFALTACLAATNVAPAVLLANQPGNRTLGPAILLFREDPEFGLGPACGLAVVVLAINVTVAFLRGSATREARPAG